MNTPASVRLVAVVAAALCVRVFAESSAAPAIRPFDGWEGMRVIPIDGRAERLLVADLGHDGRDDVILVNTRQARLDIYRWLPAGDRAREDKTDPERPNELPLAPEWAHGEVSIDELPVDAVAHDIDGDKRPELLVLTNPSNRVAIYSQAADKPVDAKNAWKKTGEWNLLTGTPTGKSGCLLVRDLPGGRHELLVSYEQGIQQLPLVLGSRAVWLAPRETRSRLDWSLADLDGDGDDDLVEWSNVARQVVRWYETAAAGALLPAQTLYDQNVESLRTAASASGKADILLLGGSDKGVLRRYQLARGEATEVGRQDALPLANAARRGWCGIQVGDGAEKTPAIVAVDSAQPRLRVHRLGADGWLAEETFPSIGGIKSLAAPAAVPGTLLVWAKDAADLHRCRWENGRLTYPQPWEQEGKDRKIVALDSIGATVWWAQRVGSDLDLFVWQPDEKEPVKTRYAGLGPKVEQVVWLGGDMLLVQDAFAPAGRLVTLGKDGKPGVSAPALLAKMDAGEYAALEVNGRLRKARLTDGVLQWLGDDLHPVDQVMLTEGQKIGSYLPIAGTTPAEAWALEQGGGFLHRLRADDAGVMRVAKSVKPPAGTSLRWDPVLGSMLVDQERVMRLSQGQPWELKLLESVDGRIGRRSGVSESTIHRILVTDLDGDASDDVALCDDRKHQLTALLRKPEVLERSVSWQVFEDRKYPYDGGESKDLVSEPRRIAGLDADADGDRDLAMLSQDRLVIYLGRDDEKGAAR
jgi:hypothetical protein